jgi:EAL domain-containing protein (putative c-di-GMP-specific phosphodiesterase class I)
MLTRLRLKGVKLSIDDFGTGFSSFLQLYRAPFSELKVDRAFVSRMQDDPEAMTIVEICIQLAHKLKMRTVAEGVEDEAALQVLAGLGCDLAQGYHIARPMPEQGLREWIRAQILSTG